MFLFTDASDNENRSRGNFPARILKTNRIYYMSASLWSTLHMSIGPLFWPKPSIATWVFPWVACSPRKEGNNYQGVWELSLSPVEYENQNSAGALVHLWLASAPCTIPRGHPSTHTAACPKGIGTSKCMLHDTTCSCPCMWSSLIKYLIRIQCTYDPVPKARSERRQTDTSGFPYRHSINFI